jgi:hypothetical protein
MFSRWAVGFVSLIVVAPAGCSNGIHLYPVKGTVTFKGKPIPAGVVWFDPDVMTSSTAPQGYAYIKNGEFDSSANGRGVAGGTYVVRVEGFDGQPGNELPLGKPLFAKYEQKTDFPKAKSELALEVPATTR